MAITLGKTAFVGTSSMTIGLSQMFGVTAASSNPTYLVLSALDRNEYTAKASGSVGTLSGNGHTLSLSSIGSDGRGAGLVFTYQSATGRYYNSTYGYLDQLSYVSSGSLDDVTSLSLFGTGNLSLATSYASDAYSMMQVDSAGFLGSATVATEPSFTGTVPLQATPNSIATVANSFIGQAWNMDGCWVLASTIAAEAGASLPAQSTVIGMTGQANGEWIVAFNGPGGSSGNWQSLVHTGEIVVIGTSGGGGHITTCVSGSGSTAMLIDNITYENNQGKITNPANDGSSSDIIVAAPHIASQEWSGVQASSVVIYELDTPVVSATVASDSLACLASQSLASLFAASDPVNRAITSWQAYDTAPSDSLLLSGAATSAHSVASAVTATSLALIALQAGTATITDTLDVRAFNGLYWGDWQSLSVTVTAPPPAPPVLALQTTGQSWVGGKAVSLALPSGTFNDPQHQALSYTATLSSGQALPSWLGFNAMTETFSGTAPLSAQSLSIKVTATDTSALSTSETFTATILGAPTVTAQTATQSWQENKSIAFTLAANTFTDPQGQKLTYTASQSNGQALPSWLTFNPANETFGGTAPVTAQSLILKVTATDASGLAVSETFAATVAPAAPTVTAQTTTQSWQENRSIAFTLAASTFTDPQGQKLTYTASQSNGLALPSWLTFNAANETFGGTAPVTAQSLILKVTATDASGLAVSETFAATVAPAAPTVTAQTTTQSWQENRSIAFTLAASTFTDPQGQKLTYTASQSNGLALPSWLTFNAANETFNGTAPVTAQSLILKVTATDTSGLAVSETFAATVAPAAPTVTAQTTTQSWQENKSIAFTLAANTFTDPQGQKLTYTASQSNGLALPSWLTFNAANETFNGTAPLTAQSMIFKVTATDTSGLAVSETFAATVAPAAPAVTAQTTSQSWQEGKLIALTLAANTFTDPQGQKLTYTASQSNGLALPSWLTFNAANETFNGTAPLTAQSMIFKVTATDTSGLAVSETFAATVAPAAPAVTAQTTSQSWQENKSIAFTLAANTFTDPQGQKLTYTASQSNGLALPSWLTFNPANETFAGTAPLTAQSLIFKVTATDTSGLAVSETFAASVTPPVVKPGITISATPPQTWTDGQNVDLVLPGNMFTDALGLKMTFAAYEASGPNITSWLKFNPTTDEFTGKVPTTASGNSWLAVVATDAQNTSAIDLFPVTFAAAGSTQGIASSTGAAGIAPSVDVTHLANLLAFHS